MASEVTVFDNACDMRSGAFLGPHWEVHQRILNHFNIFYTGNTSYIINENLFLMTKLPLVCFLVKSKGYGKVSNACASCTSSPYRVMFPSEIEQLYVQVLLGNKILRLTQNWGIKLYCHNLYTNYNDKQSLSSWIKCESVMWNLAYLSDGWPSCWNTEYDATVIPIITGRKIYYDWPRDLILSPFYMFLDILQQCCLHSQNINVVCTVTRANQRCSFSFVDDS